MIFPLCVFCGEAVHPLKPGSFSRQQGWTQVRQEGGAHSLVEAQALSEVAHNSCIADRQWQDKQQSKLAPVSTVRHALCDECRKPLDPRQVGTWAEVVGWVGLRTQGGTNAIALRSPTGLYLHQECWTARHYQDQPSLF